MYADDIGIIFLGEAVKVSKLILSVALLFGSSILVAEARSCTEQGQACANWANTNIPDLSERRTAANLCLGSRTRDCIARCKQGQKHFVGITGTQTYPIQTCQ
jgi:hypothetical protein